MKQTHHETKFLVSFTSMLFLLKWPFPGERHSTCPTLGSLYYPTLVLFHSGHLTYSRIFTQKHSIKHWSAKTGRSKRTHVNPNLAVCISTLQDSIFLALGSPSLLFLYNFNLGCCAQDTFICFHISLKIQKFKIWDSPVKEEAILSRQKFWTKPQQTWSNTNLQ